MSQSTQEPDSFSSFSSLSSQSSQGSQDNPYEYRNVGEHATNDTALPIFIATLDEYIVKNNLPNTSQEELKELVLKLRSLIDKRVDLDTMQHIVDVLSPRQMEELLKFQENEALSTNDYIDVDNMSKGKLLILFKMGLNFMRSTVDEQISNISKIPGIILDTPLDILDIDTVKDVLVETKDTADKITKETKQACDDYITTTTRKIKNTLAGLYNTFYKIFNMMHDEYQFDVWDLREEFVDDEFKLIIPSEQEEQLAIMRFINATSLCNRKNYSQEVYTSYKDLDKKASAFKTRRYGKKDFLQRSSTVPNNFKPTVVTLPKRTDSQRTDIDSDVDEFRFGGKSKKRRKSGKRKTRRKQKKRKTRRKRRCKK